MRQPCLASHRALAANGRDFGLTSRWGKCSSTIGSRQQMELNCAVPSDYPRLLRMCDKVVFMPQIVDINIVGCTSVPIEGDLFGVA